MARIRIPTDFNDIFYKTFYNDLSSFDIHALIEHYLNHGRAEKRLICVKDFTNIYPRFDVQFYKKYYTDISHMNSIELMRHYVLHGINENRITCEQDFFILYPRFDTVFYRKIYRHAYYMITSDLIVDYMINGVRDNRVTCISDFYRMFPSFDMKFYKTYYTDLRQMDEVGLIRHYILHGMKEGRIINEINYGDKYPDFDITFYKTIYVDARHMNNIEIYYHYMKYGIIENRMKCIDDFHKIYPSFNIDFYRCIYELTGIDADIVMHYLTSYKNTIQFTCIDDFMKIYPNFNSEFYKRIYDLDTLNTNEIIKYYLKFGESDKHLMCIDDFINIYPHIDIEFYKTLNNISSDNLQVIKTIISTQLKNQLITNMNDFYIKYPSFCTSFYSLFYEELHNMSYQQLMKHYYEQGNVENRLTCIDDFYKLYPDFDVKYYKSFNQELHDCNIYELMRHYHLIGHVKNIEYMTYDFDAMILINKTNPLYQRIYNHTFFRQIKSYDKLKDHYNAHTKPYYIHNNASFYIYYNDFDITYYKRHYNYTDDDDFNVLLKYHTIGIIDHHIINDKTKIIIYTPPFSNKCGGIVVMHYLAHIINNLKDKKVYAKLFMHNNLKYNNIFCTDFARIDEINDSTIVIYPEIVYNNPLNATHVVRWILLELGIEMPKNHHINFGKDDKIYYWESSRVSRKQLTCPWFNPIFTNMKKPRTETCYLVKKGRLIHKQIHYMHPSNSISIEDMSHAEISIIFNKCKYFYSYDPNTMYIIFAAVCGCVPIIHPIDNVTKETYFMSRLFYFNNIIHNKCIVYGNNKKNIVAATININECEQYYKDLFESYKTTVVDFINDMSQR